LSVFSPRSERVSHPQRVQGKKPAQLSAKRQGLDVRYGGKHPQVDKTYKKPWFDVGGSKVAWKGATGEAAHPIKVAHDSRESSLKKYVGVLVNK
jgi:hypothetical protein